MKKINIAIDGYSSCGKSTLAKALASDLGFIYVDTGAMYRTVSLYALRNGFIENGSVNENELIKALDQIEVDFIPRNGQNIARLNGEEVEEEIRSMAISNIVSPVSKIGRVRRKMQELQKEMASEGGVVMDGRDIGTAVLPNAELKIFMTANDDIRAQRRHDELMAKGKSVSFEEVKENLLLRDKIDSERVENPLVQAEDARVLDNSHISREQQLELVKSWVKGLTL